MYGGIPAQWMIEIWEEEKKHREKLNKKFKAYISYCFKCGKEKPVKKLQWDEDNGKMYCGTCFPKRRREVKEAKKEEQRRKTKENK